MATERLLLKPPPGIPLHATSYSVERSRCQHRWGRTPTQDTSKHIQCHSKPPLGWVPPIGTSAHHHLRTTTSAFPSQWVSSIHSHPLQFILHIAPSGKFLKAYRSGHSLSRSLTQASYHTWNETQASPLSLQAPNHLA